jgi:biuret amidohydrolase
VTEPDGPAIAVLFVECQNGLLGEASILPAIAEVARPLLPVMGRLAQGARDAGHLVVHLTYVPVAHNRSSNRRAPLFRGLLPRLDEWDAAHDAVAVVPEIGVGPDDLVLARHTGISPTYGTETFKLLRNVGVRTVVLAGISLNLAITLVAAQAADENFDVVVATDAVAGAPPEYAAAMLENTLAYLATLRRVDDMLTEWGVPAAP